MNQLAATVPADAVRPRRSLLSWALIAAGTAALAAFSFAAITAVRVVQESRVDETRPAPVIVVFGAAEYAGRPSPVFRARLEHAYSLFQSGIAPIVITTGGAGGETNFSEGGVGRDYLSAHGIADRHLIAETQSDDTAESAQRVAAILRTNRVSECVAVSDAYHMFRVKQMLAAEGIRAFSSPRPDSIPHSRIGRILAALREGLSYLLWKLHIT